MRTNGAKVAVVGGVVVAVVGAGVGAYALMSDSDEGGSSVTSEDDRNRVKTGPPSAAEVRSTAKTFLSAWKNGELKKAAAVTDSPADAGAALLSYHKEAHVSQVAFDPGTPSQRTVPFNVRAVIDYGTQKAPWQYASELTVTRDKATGKPVLDWDPSVVHPHLREGDTLKTGEADAPPIKAVDRNGVALSAKSHPALRGVLSSLRERYGDKTDGRAGVELWIDRAEPKGSDAKSRAAERPDETLKVLSKGTPGTLRTTLDARMQTNAEAQVNKHRKAAVVAVKPSTGEILAVANSPADGFNTALQGSYAPGSTMKVITASLLLEKGLAGYDKPHPCPKYYSYGGWKFQNDKKFEIKDGTFAQSFARSCNTAFISQAKKIKDDALTQQSRDVFGIGLNWQTGVPTFDGAVPVQHDAPKAASMIGQGGVRMNPLNMASVAATVQSGTFRQPYLVSPQLDNRQLAKAPRTLSADALQQLRSLMRLTATSGTAAEAMSGLGGDMGAKTGSAEVMNQKKPNGWLTAYRGDVAAAAVVPEGGHGGDSAGPLVAAILRAG